MNRKKRHVETTAVDMKDDQHERSEGACRGAVIIVWTGPSSSRGAIACIYTLSQSEKEKRRKKAFGALLLRNR
jgi:hypothetical protein